MVEKLTILYVLEPFLTKPFEEIHLADLSRELKQPHPTIRQHLNRLETNGVLKKKTKGRLTLYSLNLENPLTIQYLSIVETNKLIRIAGKNLILKELISFLNNNLNEKNIAIIFGSASKNITTANDIDLIITNKITFSKDLNQISEKLNKKIHLINVETLNTITTTLKEEIQKKHLIIQGNKEVLKWLILKN